MDSDRSQQQTHSRELDRRWRGPAQDGFKWMHGAPSGTDSIVDLQRSRDKLRRSAERRWIFVDQRENIGRQGPTRSDAHDGFERSEVCQRFGLEWIEVRQWAGFDRTNINELASNGVGWHWWDLTEQILRSITSFIGFYFFKCRLEIILSIQFFIEFYINYMSSPILFPS